MFSNQSLTRHPAVAGQFYPAESEQLANQVVDFLNRVKPVSSNHIKAVIVPHAGFIYSGPVAATAYKSLQQHSEQIQRVILLGPSHRVGFHGVATNSANVYEMPMGSIKIDRASINLIENLPQVQQLDKAHEFEHSLEVQLPFLQTILNDFILVPLVVGDCPANQVAEVLELLWGGDETLIVISSDLSHFHSYEEARVQDQNTSEAILSLAPEKIQYDDACGRNPVNGLLVAAKKYQLKPDLIDLRNSGDTAGSHDRVVGYGSYLFYD